MTNNKARQSASVRPFTGRKLVVVCVSAHREANLCPEDEPHQSEEFSSRLAVWPQTTKLTLK